MLQSKLASITPGTNLYSCMVFMKLCQRTTVSDPFLCLEVGFNTVMWNLRDHRNVGYSSEIKYTLEHDQKESSAHENVEGSIPYLTGEIVRFCLFLDEF